MTSLTHVRSGRPAATDLLAERHGQQPRYVKNSLVLLSMIVIICKSRYFDTLALAKSAHWTKHWNDGSASSGPLFLGGITDSRKFVGHGGKSESNCLLQPILQRV